MALLSASTTTKLSPPKNVAIPHSFFTAPQNQEVPFMLGPYNVGLCVESLHWNMSLLLTVRAILSYVKMIKINGFSWKSSFKHLFWDTIQKYKVKKVEIMFCCLKCASYKVYTYIYVYICVLICVLIF